MLAPWGVCDGHLTLLALTGQPCNGSGTHPRRDKDLATSRSSSALDPAPGGTCATRGTRRRDVGLGLVLHREPTRRGQPKRKRVPLPSKTARTAPSLTWYRATSPA